MIETPTGYELADEDRFLDESRSGQERRTEFARDRARVLHSSALRRLGAKTQVLSPSGGDFARTRLTHSLEVAQVGREMALELGTDPDLVDMACLSHDLGHPPFGHNGETALNTWAESIGGFEGNAQTLRLLTRIEPKVFGKDGESFGLNLTRASLDATCKYPWRLIDGKPELGGGHSVKFGVYEDDAAVFDWVRKGALPGQKCVEAQIMDFADDVAYSVHDFEDAIVSGFVKIRDLTDSSIHEELIDKIQAWAGSTVTLQELEEAFERLQGNDYWPDHYDSTGRDLGRLKNLTSSFIGSFVGRATDATLAANGASISRYSAHIITPVEVRAEIAVLKGLVSVFLMTNASRRPFYEWQRAILTELCEVLLAANGANLDNYSSAAWLAANGEADQRRVIVDQVASLTDQSALTLHNRLVGSST
jgi:dGTPase